MPTCPIIASARLVRNALARLKNVLELTIQNLVVYDSTFHIDHYCSSSQVCDLRTWSQICAPTFSTVNISEEATQSFVVNRICLLRVFSKRKFPESEPNLVPALTDLDCNNFSRHNNK